MCKCGKSLIIFNKHFDYQCETDNFRAYHGYLQYYFD